jgi:hypothetical protein
MPHGVAWKRLTEVSSKARKYIAKLLLSWLRRKAGISSVLIVVFACNFESREAAIGT